MLGLCKCFLIFSWLVIPLHLWFRQLIKYVFLKTHKQTQLSSWAWACASFYNLFDLRHTTCGSVGRLDSGCAHAVSARTNH